MIIKEVRSRIIEDSRGQDTIAVCVNGGAEASSPNGKSTGEYETKSYYKSLNFCVGFLNNFRDKIEINKFDDLVKLEKAICKKLGLGNAREFGANSLYTFQSAVLKALAHEKKKELFEIIGTNRRMPFPVGNVVGGGLHSSAIKIHPNFQEFLVIPKSKRFSDNLKIMNYIYDGVKNILQNHGVNDEGAWLVSSTDEEVFDALNKAKVIAEKKFRVDIEIGIDAATSTLFKNRKYNYTDKKLNQSEQVKFVSELILNYDLSYVEDPFQERDFKNFSKLQKALGKKCLIVGDDLTATQYNRVVGAIRTKSINAMIIKPNQNGSLLELKRIFDLCRKHGVKTVLSHRSGETLDSGLADYAVGFGADYIKCGVATRWREVKLMRLAKIEKKI
ncbi:hypothetical protein J4423_04585 [Candidatus Pacearchaeota archaeon]|nr:hypothetical protein [Candidatus Pacearchaeota archaeon]